MSEPVQQFPNHEAIVRVQIHFQHVVPSGWNCRRDQWKRLHRESHAQHVDPREVLAIRFTTHRIQLHCHTTGAALCELDERVRPDSVGCAQVHKEPHDVHLRLYEQVGQDRKVTEHFCRSRARLARWGPQAAAAVQVAQPPGHPPLELGAGLERAHEAAPPQQRGRGDGAEVAHGLLQLLVRFGSRILGEVVQPQAPRIHLEVSARVDEA
mmetsp:Transcript_97412/g.279904  ORF Transcript_97412/g.279904 Transcript_97412/m.279904 type:complete len:210 (-) Transcript_97412:469-1098(-)